MISFNWHLISTNNIIAEAILSSIVITILGYLRWNTRKI